MPPTAIEEVRACVTDPEAYYEKNKVYAPVASAILELDARLRAVEEAHPGPSIGHLTVGAFAVPMLSESELAEHIGAPKLPRDRVWVCHECVKVFVAGIPSATPASVTVPCCICGKPLVPYERVEATP